MVLQRIGDSNTEIRVNGHREYRGNQSEDSVYDINISTSAENPIPTYEHTWVTGIGTNVNSNDHEPIWRRSRGDFLDFSCQVYISFEHIGRSDDRVKFTPHLYLDDADEPGNSHWTPGSVRMDRGDRRSWAQISCPRTPERLGCREFAYWNHEDFEVTIRIDWNVDVSTTYHVNRVDQL